MKKKQILTYSIALSIVISLFVVATVVITSSGSTQETAYAEAKIEKSLNL